MVVKINMFSKLNASELTDITNNLLNESQPVSTIMDVLNTQLQDYIELTQENHEHFVKLKSVESDDSKDELSHIQQNISRSEGWVDSQHTSFTLECESTAQTTDAKDEEESQLCPTKQNKHLQQNVYFTNTNIFKATHDNDLDDIHDTSNHSHRYKKDVENIIDEHSNRDC